MRAKIRDTEIFFDVEGSSLVVEATGLTTKPTAFLVHGGPGADHTGFKPTFSRLSDRLQLVYFDHRGQGRSARGDKSTYILDNNVEDMEALRQYLGLEKIVVIGASYGGMVSMAYAARYPEQVSHLIVMATAANYRFLERAKEILTVKGSPEQIEICQRLWQGSFRDEAQLKDYFRIMGPLYSLTYDPQLSDQTWQRTILSVDAINQAFSGFLRTFDIVGDLVKITAPTLVIGGQHDWICPPEFSQEIADAIANAQLIIFERSAHLIRADQPEAMLEAINHFLFPAKHYA